MNITLLHNEFKNIDLSGFNSTDPRFDEISTLVQSGNFTEAARLSEVIISSGIYDIRLICYFLHGYWIENGLVSLIDLMYSIHNITVNNWDAIGPIHKREIVFEKSVEWLFKQILKKIQYEERKKTVVWEEWKKNTHSDEINNILEFGEIFRSSINDRFEYKLKYLIDLWSKIEKWLSIFQQIECQQSEVVLKLEFDDVEVESMEIDNQKEKKSILSEEENKTYYSTNKLKNKFFTIESSFHMNLLLRKLSAFEQLIERGDFLKAALIADDINQIVGNFNPKFYFPKTFETFLRLQAVNFDELDIYSEHRESRIWQMMQEWMKVDIDSFINAKMD